jgi:hypothetical protein
VHEAEWREPHIDAAFDGVWRLVLAGLINDGEMR